MEKQEIRTFGRRHGKKLSARKQWLMNNLLPALAPSATDTNTAILEIGFGAGEHLRELALANPTKTVIGAEPFANGVAALLGAITDADNRLLPKYEKHTHLAGRCPNNTARKQDKFRPDLGTAPRPLAQGTA